MRRSLLAGTLALLGAGLLGAGLLAGCGDLPEGAVGAGEDGDVVLTLGKRSAPWPDEVARIAEDGLIEVLETDAVVEEAWAALEPEALPTGGDPATSLEEGAHLPPDELPDDHDRVLMRVRHVESSACPVRVADLSGDGDGLTLTLDDGDPDACTDDANPFTALIAVDVERLPPADELPDEVDAGEHWTLALRRVSEVEDLAGTIDPAQDADPRLGGMSVEPSTAAPGDELAVIFPAEDPDEQPDEEHHGPAPHERGVLFSLEARAGDTWEPETHLISDRDPDGPRVFEPGPDTEADDPADLLVDDPEPDHLVLPDDLAPGLYRVCESLDLERCDHVDVAR